LFGRIFYGKPVSTFPENALMQKILLEKQCIGGSAQLVEAISRGGIATIKARPDTWSGRVESTLLRVMGVFGDRDTTPSGPPPARRGVGGMRGTARQTELIS